MKNIEKILCATALLAALFSCSKDNTTGSDPVVSKTEADGKILFDDGTPAAGVVVSDGYTCTATAQDGTYSLKLNTSAAFVSYSIPANAAVETGGTYGLPVFYKKISSASDFNFTLKKQAVESKFRMIAIGDPQVTSSSDIARYKNETMADLKSYVESKGGDMPTYAITLGDIVGNKWDLYPTMFPTMNVTQTGGVPVFQTIGNHDHQFPFTGSSLEVNNLTAQRKFEGFAGPVNYSFNRGDVHFVSMDDVRHTAKASADYDGGFLDWQYEWLKQDLSYVDKTKTVILCVHIPWREAFTTDFYTTDKYPEEGFYQEILDLLGEYADCAIYAGHTHNNVNCSFDDSSNKHKDKNGKYIPEYIVGTACGAWWKGTICTDGAPNGYGVFEYEDAKLVNQIYKATRYDEGFQMRIYRATDFPELTANTSDGVKTYKWGLKTEEGRAMVNVWNVNEDWTFEVYENGVLQTNTIIFKQTAYRDMWAKYYFYSDLMLKSTSGYPKASYHMAYYNINDKNTDDIKVVAHDGYGHTFTQSGYTTRLDRSCASYQ